MRLWGLGLAEMNETTGTALIVISINVAWLPLAFNFWVPRNIITLLYRLVTLQHTIITFPSLLSSFFLSFFHLVQHGYPRLAVFSHTPVPEPGGKAKRIDHLFD